MIAEKLKKHGLDIIQIAKEARAKGKSRSEIIMMLSILYIAKTGETANVQEIEKEIMEVLPAEVAGKFEFAEGKIQQFKDGTKYLVLEKTRHEWKKGEKVKIYLEE